MVGDFTKQEGGKKAIVHQKKSGFQHFDIIFTFYDPIQLIFCPSVAVEDPRKGKLLLCGQWKGIVLGQGTSSSTSTPNILFCLMSMLQEANTPYIKVETNSSISIIFVGVIWTVSLSYLAALGGCNDRADQDGEGLNLQWHLHYSDSCYHRVRSQ